MKLNKQCHCRVNPCKCSSKTDNKVPIIIKKEKKVTEYCTEEIIEPVITNKCPTNKITSISRLGNEVIVVMNDCTYYSTDIDSVDVESFSRNNSKPRDDIYINDMTFLGSELTLTRTDGVEFKVNLSSLDSVDKYVSSGLIVENKTLRLYLNDGSTIDIDVSGIIGTVNTDTEIISGKVENTEIVLVKINSSEIRIETNSLIETVTERVVTDLSKLSYEIKKVPDTYTVTGSDMTGRVMILATGTEATQEIILGTLSDEYIGRAVIIAHRMAQKHSILNLTGSKGVSINPPDISPLRRSGNSIACVYVGQGDWQLFGEIP